MADKLETQWYNLTDIDNNEDMKLSTDFTEEEEDLAYKRYKMTRYTL